MLHSSHLITYILVLTGIVHTLRAWFLRWLRRGEPSAWFVLTKPLFKIFISDLQTRAVKYKLDNIL